MALRSTLQQTAEGWIRDLESCKLDNVVSNWTDDIYYAVHPDALGDFPMNKEKFRTYPRAIAFFNSLKWFKITIEEMFIDTEQKTVTMIATSQGELNMGPYENDYAFILTMTEDGTKVKKLNEYINIFKAEGAIQKEQNSAQQ